MAWLEAPEFAQETCRQIEADEVLNNLTGSDLKLTEDVAPKEQIARGSLYKQFFFPQGLYFFVGAAFRWNTVILASRHVLSAIFLFVGK